MNKNPDRASAFCEKAFHKYRKHKQKNTICSRNPPVILSKNARNHPKNGAKRFAAFISLFRESFTRETFFIALSGFSAGAWQKHIAVLPTERFSFLLHDTPLIRFFAGRRFRISSSSSLFLSPSLMLLILIFSAIMSSFSKSFSSRPQSQQ